MLIVCPLVRPLDRNVCFVSRSFRRRGLFWRGPWHRDSHGQEVYLDAAFSTRCGLISTLGSFAIMRTVNNERSDTVNVFARGLVKLRGPSDNLPQFVPWVSDVWLGIC